MDYPVSDTFSVEKGPKREHRHDFDGIEGYWAFVRALPRHAVREAVGVALTDTQLPFDVELVAPPGATPPRALTLHLSWRWSGAKSLVLALADGRFPKFPGSVEIDASRASHIEIAKKPFVITFSSNSDAGSFSATVDGYLDSMVQLMALATAPSVEARDELLNCLSTLKVTRRSPP